VPNQTTRAQKTVATTLLASLLWATAAPQAHAVSLYSVRAKDTIAKIAHSQGVSVERLLKANADLGRSSNLKIGQLIIVPDRDEVVIKDEDDDTLPRLPVQRAAHPAVAVPSHVAPATPVAVVVPKPSLVAAHDDALALVPPPISTAVHPMPAPTPVAQEDMPSVTHSASETIAVLNEQVIRLNSSATSGALRHHPQLASRRGRLLTQITSAARRFMGVPYVWGGTTSRGYDCSGFTMTMYRLAGISIKRLADEQYYQGKATSEPLPGDLVFFTTYLPGPSHVGIYLGNNLFIHASSRKGVTISSLGDGYFKKRYLGARRFF
jgi:cell wall-associated NlpC family hydrolase